MKLIHIIYSGLGGHASVVFPHLEYFAKYKKSVSSTIFFYGIEKIYNGFKSKCANYLIGNFYFNSNHFFDHIKLLFKLLKLKPNKIIVHTSSIIPVIFYKLFVREVDIVKVLHTDIRYYRLSDWLILYLSVFFFKKIIVLNTNYSNQIKKKISKIFHNKILIINPGIKLKKKYYKKNISKKKKVIIGMAARFDVDKKQEILINCVKSYNKKNTKKIILKLAGGGKNFLNIRSQIKKNKLQNEIFLNGYLSGHELNNWYKTLDIYVHASNFEVVNTAILEAMSFSKPIIASNIKPIRSQVSQGFNVGLVCKNSPLAFEKSISTLINNDNLYQRLAKNCYKQIKLKYDFNSHIRKYLNIYLNNL